MFNIGALIDITQKVVNIYDKYVRRKDYEKRQDEADKIDDNPGAAFSDHFGNGVHDKDDASETSETKT